MLSPCLSTWSVQTRQQGWSEMWVSQAGYDPPAWESDSFKRKWQKTWKAGWIGWKIMLIVSSDIADRVQQMKPSGTNSEQTCTAVTHTNCWDLSQNMPWRCLSVLRTGLVSKCMWKGACQVLLYRKRTSRSGNPLGWKQLEEGSYWGRAGEVWGEGSDIYVHPVACKLQPLLV